MPNISKANVEGQPAYPHNPRRSGFFRELRMRWNSPRVNEPAIHNADQESFMNQHVDRRSLLAGAATISAVGTASIATAETGTALEGEFLAEWAKLNTTEKREFLTLWRADAELVRLGKELDGLLAEWRTSYDETERLGDMWNEQSYAEGVHPQACEESGRYFGKAEYKRHFDISRETGAEAVITANYDICDRIDAVGKAIRKIKPSTIAGLAIWAKAARFDVLYPDVTPTEEIEEWDKEQAARLFDEIERMAGVSNVPNEATQRSPVMALFQEWTEQRDTANAYGAAKDHDEDRFSILCETANATMTRLLDLPAADICDLAAKLVAATDHGAYPDLAGFDGGMSLVREAAAIVGRVEHLENV